MLRDLLMDEYSLNDFELEKMIEGNRRKYMKLKIKKQWKK